MIFFFADGDLLLEIFGVLKLFDEFGVGLYEFDFEELYLGVVGIAVIDGVVEGVIVV